MISSLELARLCGVSQGTVDRALHDRPGISAATRDRILAMAREHGYLPNPAAREMMGLATSRAVGVVLPDFAIQTPFFMDLAAIIGRRLHRDGLRLSLWPCPEDSFAAAVEEIAARRLRAIIILLPPDDLRIDPVISRHLPVFALQLPNPSPGITNLIPDERAIGRAATAHLIKLGHRRIVHLVGERNHWAMLERTAGYAEALEEVGGTPLVLHVDTPDLLARLRAEDVSAVFTHNDPMAWSVIRRATAAGLTVPGDLSVVGVDRSPTFVGFETMPLSSVPYPFAGLAEQLAAILAGKPKPGLERPKVIPGSTTGKMAAGGKHAE